MNRTSKKVEKANELVKELYANITLPDGSSYLDYVTSVFQISRSENEKIVTLLMGTLEYNLLTPKDILFQFGMTVRDAVIAVSRFSDLSDDEYNNKVKNNPIARAVKIAEFKHLLNINKISQEDFDRAILFFIN